MDFAKQVEALQAATRVLAGVALRSLGALDGVITLSQFRMLAVLAELGRARSARVARALGLDASTVTRLADRMVAAGHVERGSVGEALQLFAAAAGHDHLDTVRWMFESSARLARPWDAG